MRLRTRPTAGRVGLLAGLLLVLAALPGAGAQVPAPPGFPQAAKLSYTILRDDDEVGLQTVDFRPEGNRLTVRTHIEIAVKQFFITVYRFTHDAEETWVGGRLQQFNSRTDDDGKPRMVELWPEGDHFGVIYNNKQRDLPGPIYPTSLWNPATVEQAALFDTIKGRMRAVKIVDKGVETIQGSHGPAPAHRYSISGELTREVWYDADGHIDLVKFPAEDGSQISLVRQ